MEEVEDEEHFLLRCEGWRQEREMLAGSWVIWRESSVLQLMTGRWH